MHLALKVPVLTGFFKTPPVPSNVWGQPSMQAKTGSYYEDFRRTKGVRYCVCLPRRCVSPGARIRGGGEARGCPYPVSIYFDLGVPPPSLQPLSLPSSQLLCAIFKLICWCLLAFCARPARGAGFGFALDMNTSAVAPVVDAVWPPPVPSRCPDPDPPMQTASACLPTALRMSLT
jgi:hypothetical protein